MLHLIRVQSLALMAPKQEGPEINHEMTHLSFDLCMKKIIRNPQFWFYPAHPMAPTNSILPSHRNVMGKLQI